MDSHCRVFCLKLQKLDKVELSDSKFLFTKGELREGLGRIMDVEVLERDANGVFHTVAESSVETIDSIHKSGKYVYELIFDLLQEGHCIADTKPEEVAAYARQLFEEAAKKDKMSEAAGSLDRLLSPFKHTESGEQSLSSRLREKATNYAESLAKPLREAAAKTEIRMEGITEEITLDGEKAKGWIERFWKEEKWAGKKGFAMGGAAIALGVVLYSTWHFFGKKNEYRCNQAEGSIKSSRYT